ncbi:hypothetical protein L8106_12690 [Lyngbya sp. PCC 8106]|nr:hypothetical protein L8106_12690 [Lyngbya sp. PCC 8106]
MISKAGVAVGLGTFIDAKKSKFIRFYQNILIAVKQLIYPCLIFDVQNTIHQVDFILTTCP